MVQVDPLDDIDVINLELALADLSQIEKRMERLQKGEHLAASLWATGTLLNPPV
jgi:obg-like ATPase 1